MSKEEKTADEMFKGLGYRKLQPIGLQQCAYTNGKGKEIIITQMKRIGLYGVYQLVTLEELKAINKKCEELRMALKKEWKEIIRR